MEIQRIQLSFSSRSVHSSIVSRLRYRYVLCVVLVWYHVWYVCDVLCSFDTRRGRRFQDFMRWADIFAVTLAERSLQPWFVNRSGRASSKGGSTGQRGRAVPRRRQCRVESGGKRKGQRDARGWKGKGCTGPAGTNWCKRKTPEVEGSRSRTALRERGPEGGTQKKRR